MKNRKGFSLVEILAVMVILGILVTLGFATYTRYQKKAIEDSYDTLRRSASNAAENYFMDHNYADEVTIQELVDQQYLENNKDPQYDKKTCSGKVTRVTNLEGATGELSSDTYKVVINCKKHDSCEMFPAAFECDEKGGIITNGEKAYPIGLANRSFGNQISLVIRVKFNDLSSDNYMEFFGNWEAAGGGLRLDENDKFSMNLYSAADNSYHGITSSTGAYINKWYVIVGTLKDGRMKLYVNGQIQKTASGASYATFPGSIKPSPYGFMIGGNPEPEGAITVGGKITVSDALIFTQALDETEIANYFSVPNVGLNYGGSKTPIVNQKF